VILSEDTRHSGKLLQHYNIKTPLLSFHKFNEREREPSILRRLHEGEAVALISDAGTPGISDPGMELVSRLTSINFGSCILHVSIQYKKHTVAISLPGISSCEPELAIHSSCEEANNSYLISCFPGVKHCN